MKRYIKTFVILIFSVVSLYLILVFLFGGFGMRPVNDLAFTRGDSMLLFAHRGILNYFPEHSVEGANEAHRLGFNAIEIDIRKSADNAYIIFHDETAERMLGINAAVSTLQLSKIKKYPLLFNNKRTTNHVLTVDEFLQSFSKDFVIYFDLKLFRFKDAVKIIELIKKHSAEKTCIIASADVVLIFYMEMKYPEMLTALEGFDSGKEWTYGSFLKTCDLIFYRAFFKI